MTTLPTYIDRYAPRNCTGTPTNLNPFGVLVKPARTWSFALWGVSFGPPLAITISYVGSCWIVLCIFSTNRSASRDCNICTLTFRVSSAVSRGVSEGITASIVYPRDFAQVGKPSNCWGPRPPYAVSINRSTEIFAAVKRPPSHRKLLLSLFSSLSVEGLIEAASNFVGRLTAFVDCAVFVDCA